VNEIAACEILGQFLKTMKDDDFQSMRQKLLDTLSGLINAPKLVKEAHTKGKLFTQYEKQFY
jgi:DnaJ family protein C protein 13